MFFSAVCDSAELPTVSNSFTYASSTDLEVGTRATIQCYRGYHFPGAPVAINTPVPTLPTTTAPPVPVSCEFRTYCLFHPICKLDLFYIFCSLECQGVFFTAKMLSTEKKTGQKPQRAFYENNSVEQELWLV